MKNYFDLTGMSALVTGSYGHLGRAIAISLAEHGAHVYLNGKNKNKLDLLKEDISERGYNASIALFDITNHTQIKNFFKKNKKLHILVNNANKGKQFPFHVFSKKEFKKAFDISLISIADLVNIATPSLVLGAKEIGSSSIINISSIYGMVSPDPSIYLNTKYHNPSSYGATKAALIQYTRHAAIHLAKNKIRVNCISPGPFPNEKKIKTKFFLKKLKKKIPLNRFGKPEDITTSIIFLASKKSSFITGSNIVVDGGWTAW